MDTPVDKLWFVITKDPFSGHIINTDVEEQQPGSISSFTMKDIHSEAILYSHGNGSRPNAAMDLFYIYVTDGVQKSGSGQVCLRVIIPNCRIIVIIELSLLLIVCIVAMVTTQIDVTIISHGDGFPTFKIDDLIVDEGSEKIFQVQSVEISEHYNSVVDTYYTLDRD